MAKYHFLFCLPIRLGAFIITLWNSFVDAVLAGVLWYTLAEEKRYLVTTASKVVVGICAFVYTIFAIYALIGLWGVIKRKVDSLQLYLRVLSWMFGLNVILSIIHAAVLILESDSTLISACKDEFSNDKQNQQSLADCQNEPKAFKAGAIIGIIIMLLGQAYQIWTLYQYSEELLENEAKIRTKTAFYPMQAEGYKYVSTPTQEPEPQGFADVSKTYPYTDPQSSYESQV